MKISKPKRHSSGTYEGQIYKNAKKEYITINIKRCRIVALKNNNEDNYIYVKEPNIAKTICELTDKMLKIVKENISTWFHNTMSSDIIDDYFIPNIIYDKSYGQLIKFKILNEVNNIQKDQYVNIDISVRKIRFFKQKFVTEWHIEDIKNEDIFSNISNIEEFDNEDIPIPDHEEIQTLKKQYIRSINNELSIINDKLSLLTDRKNMFLGALNKISECDNFSDISNLCDHLDKLLE